MIKTIFDKNRNVSITDVIFKKSQQNNPWKESLRCTLSVLPPHVIKSNKPVTYIKTRMQQECIWATLQNVFTLLIISRGQFFILEFVSDFLFAFACIRIWSRVNSMTSLKFYAISYVTNDQRLWLIFNFKNFMSLHPASTILQIFHANNNAATNQVQGCLTEELNNQS